LTNFCRALLAFVALATPALLRADTISKPDFSLVLPAGWVEVPQEVLQAFYEEMQRQAPKGGVPRYDFAFQRDAGPPWLAYPYVLVEKTDSGRPTERELEAMQRVDMNAELKKKGDALDKVVKDSELSNLKYDKAANVIWISSRGAVVNIGIVAGLSGMIPTEGGFLQINAYAHDADFERHVETFRSIITTAKVSPALLYKPRWTDELEKYGILDFRNLKMRFAIGGGIVAIVLVYVIFRRRTA
jgi:hypothetical protein